MIRLFFILPLAFVCGCGSPSVNESQPIFGYYSHTDTAIIGYTGIQLNTDSTYYYGSGMCVGSVVDTGRFTVHNDTIILRSSIAGKVDTSNHGFGQIRPLTGDKYLLRDRKIYFWLENGTFDTSAYWQAEPKK